MSEFEQVSEGGNSQGLFGTGNQLQGGTGPAGGMSGTGFAEADGVQGTGAAVYGASVDTRGPFTPQLNGLLSASFGSSLQGLQLKRGEGTKNQKIGALAHTIGNRISLGEHITEDPKDAHSMEVISHEVAHALAGGGTGGQIMTRFVHNQLDKNGVKMTDASGTSWDGRGDEHWGERENKENRKHAAQATYQSYSELEDVLSKKKKPEEALKGSKVSGMVPQWSPDNEKRAEESAKMKGMDDPVAFAKFLKNEGGDMLEEKTHELKKWAGDKWDGAKSWLGDKWHKASSWLGNKWDGAKEWASEKWEGAKDWAGDKWQGAKDWASDKYQGAKEWLGDKWQGTKDWAGDKWQGAK